MMQTMRNQNQFNTGLSLNERGQLNYGALESWSRGDTSPASSHQRAVRPSS